MSTAARRRQDGQESSWDLDGARGVRRPFLAEPRPGILQQHSNGKRDAETPIPAGGPGDSPDTGRKKGAGQRWLQDAGFSRVKNEALLIETEEPRGRAESGAERSRGRDALDATHLRLCDSQGPSGNRAFTHVAWEKSRSLEVLPPEPRQETVVVSLGLQHNKMKGRTT